MKRIFTLVIAVGLVSLAQAQPGNRDGRQNDQRGYDNGKIIVVDHSPNDRRDDRYDDNRFGDERRRNIELNQINREYDYKIQKVRNSFFLNRWEKQRQIRQLENQRDFEISRVYAKFNKKHRYDDRNYPNNRRY